MYAIIFNSGDKPNVWHFVESFLEIHVYCVDRVALIEGFSPLVQHIE